MSLTVGWREKLDARWTPVQVVVTAVVLRHGIHLSAQSVPLAMAAESPERLAVPVTLGHEALPSQSRLVQSVTVRAEM